ESLANSEFILNDIAEKGEFTTENLALSKQVINHLVEDIMENRVVLENKENIYHLNNIIDNLVEQDVLMHDVEMIRNHDEYTFVHSVNVSAMAVIIGLAFDYDVDELKKLGLAALLHDIGKIKVDSALINKPGKLTAEEKLIMNRHSQYTYELLRERPEIDEIVALSAYQHHEKFDGTGYPQGLKGEEIVPFARIIAVADVYDALVTDRSYRKSMMSYVAAEIIQASCYTHFDPVVVKAFMQNIIIYPVGSMVELSTGEKGIVCRINPSMPARPVVIVAFSPSGNRYLPPKTIDLMKSLTVFIVKVHSPDN
ncbi:MAG: HD-GYP domain-containing protein, partial [bacterium]